jgi:hypothetical protein
MTRKARKVTVMAIRAATTGDSRAGRMTLFSTVLTWMASAPPAIQVAPISPPNSACDELEGRPRYQVSRFHRIAATSPAKITTGVMSVSSTSPPEIVFATCTDRNAPARFRQPASATATLGRRAPVAIEVAMALAVSWKPLVKSKISAVTTTTTTITVTSICRTLQSSRYPAAGSQTPSRVVAGFGAVHPASRSVRPPVAEPFVANGAAKIPKAVEADAADAADAARVAAASPPRRSRRMPPRPPRRCDSCWRLWGERREPARSSPRVRCSCPEGLHRPGTASSPGDGFP